MLESVRCPNCSTHYGLRARRVHPGTRRAECFRCGTRFRIESVVARLLTPLPEPAEELEAFERLEIGGAEEPTVAPSPTGVEESAGILEAAARPETEWSSSAEVPPEPAGMAFDSEVPEPAPAAEAESLPDLLPEELSFEALEPEAALPPPLPPFQTVSEEPDSIAAGDLELLAEPELEIEELPIASEPEPPPAPAMVPGATVRLGQADLALLGMGTAPPLTLGDLEGPENDMLEQTVVDFTTAPPPEVREEVSELPVVPTALEEDGEPHSPFSSAKDAIDKLLGGTPRSTGSRPIPTTRANTQMDVEATLSALEKTLGGIQASDLGGSVEPPPPAPAPGSDSGMGSTVRLSQAELAAAMRAPAPESLPPAAPPPLPPPPREPAPGSATMILPIAPAKPREPLLPPIQPMPPAPVPLAPPAPQGAQDSNLLRIKAGDDYFENISMEELLRMVEGFRVLEYHLVARQFSDNWIEAAKVPALRPVFERIRRQRTPAAELPPPPTGEVPAAKKGLFGGFFNRG